jgi:two-component sensor histidine kinase
MINMKHSGKAIFVSDTLYSPGRDEAVQIPFFEDVPVFCFSDLGREDNDLFRFSSVFIVSEDEQMPPQFGTIRDKAYFKQLNVNRDLSGLSASAAFSFRTEKLRAALLELGLRNSREECKKLREQTLSYNEAINSLHFVESIGDKSGIIEFMKEFFNRNCMPENLFYARGESGGHDVHMIDFTADEIVSFRESKNEYLIADSGKSYCFRIENKAGMDDVLGVENIAFYGDIAECMNFSLGIKKVFCLAIENAENKQGMATSRKNLAESIEMLQIINKILCHDLANDFAAIKMSLDMYGLSPKDRYLKLSDRSVAKGIARIDEMRNLENLLGRGKPSELYDVKEIIESLAPGYSGLSVSVKDDCRIRADSALPSVFDNLLMNALAHGNAQQVEISMELTDSMCRIRISDDGNGIDEEIKHRIFDEGFSCGSGSHSGLGLYIVKKIVERYGGNIIVENNIPRGTTFVLELPSA